MLCKIKSYCWYKCRQGLVQEKTIHVSIPDERGRCLVAATVPSASPNVSKFSSSGIPTNMTNGNRSAGMTNARNSSSFPQQQQQSANSRNSDGVLEWEACSCRHCVVGGAASSLGMMGMSMYVRPLATLFRQ
jgi:hypothetical protein